MRSILLVFVGLGAFGCGDHHALPADIPKPDEYAFDCENPLAGMAATNANDETYAAAVEAEAAGRGSKDACKSPQVSAPAAGAALDPAAPPTIAFAAKGAACLTAAPAPKGARLHCPAVTGEAYLLRLTSPGQSKAVFLAMLSVLSYTPDPAKWQAALAPHRGKPLELTISRVVYFKGDVSEGPFAQPQPIPVTVAP